MKQLVLLALCVLLVIPFLFSAGQAEAKADKVYTLKVGHASITAATRHKALVQYVGKETKGRLQIEIYPEATRGNDRYHLQ